MPATILVAEDEADLRQLVAFNLKKEGHRVLEARDGIDALDALEGGPVDLVVADVMMPRMDGLELCARLRERPDMAEVPFLFLTAKGGAEAQYLGLRAGADDYIAKPFELPDLLARIQGRLERRERDRRGGRRSTSGAPPETRWCPVCGRRVRASLCPHDGVETLAASSLQSRGALLEPGTVVGGRFRVEQPLGSGAMGAVHVAVQLSIGRKVALKVLHGTALRDETELRRFHREARLAASIDHPNVVHIVDFGVDEPTRLPFLAMSLLEGETLRDLLDRGPLPAGRALPIAAAIARGLGAAHAMGIVHRDLKPENIMVREPAGEEPRVTVLDFGVATVPRTDAQNLTGKGEIVGTPRAMSPEQVWGKEVGPESDLYGLGCLLHEMLSGRPPYRADTAAALLLEHLHADLPELPDPLPGGTPLDPALRALHRALLDKTPAQRPSSADEVAKRMSALARAAPRPPPSTEDQAGAPPPRASPADEDADTQIRTAVDRPAPRRRSAAVLGVALFLVVIGLGVYLTWGST